MMAAMPAALPPALQAMIPPPPEGASPQQIHNHHAAAAAAAAAAASVMSPYSHHLMAPPSLVRRPHEASLPSSTVEIDICAVNHQLVNPVTGKELSQIGYWFEVRRSHCACSQTRLE